MAEDLQKAVDGIGGVEDAPRFVRTFDTDRAALESGGVPDFTETKDRPVFEEHRAGVIPSMPSLTAPQERMVHGSVLDTPPRAAVAPTPLAAQVVAPPAQPLAAPLHTYASDFGDQVKATDASPTSILAAEQDSKTTQVVAEPKKGRNNLSFILASAALVVLGTGGAVLAYIYTDQTPVAVPGTLGEAPIFVEEREAVNGTGAPLMQDIEQSVSRALAANAVRLLYLDDASSTASVFGALSLPAPAVLLRNINTTGSMAGVVRAGSTQSAFFILSVSSYGETFAGMLSWELKMPADLAKLYPMYPADPNATSTPPVQKVFPTPVPTSGFRDKVVANHDTRIYKDSLDRTIMVYGYWNPQTLIIARDEIAFGAILDRLASSSTQ